MRGRRTCVSCELYRDRTWLSTCSSCPMLPSYHQLRRQNNSENRIAIKPFAYFFLCFTYYPSSTRAQISFCIEHLLHPPAQALFWQVCTSLSIPINEQSIPPNAGGGLVQFLVRYFSPFPQVVEQSLQSLHSV